MAITFETRDYVAAHGKQPRGNGTWSFACGALFFTTTGMLTEAKRKARAHFARTFDHATINILP